jgi:3-oxoacyl-[acyl-carrier protein] reductase
MTTLKNKTALVTGASRGIGRATALALPEAGAHVLAHYGRSANEAESLGAALLAQQVHSIVGDQLDVMVLNAGISKAARIARGKEITSSKGSNPMFGDTFPS